MIVLIYDTRGNPVRTLVDKPMEPGGYSVTWDGLSDAGQLAGPGVYFYRVQVGTYKKTRKIIMGSTERTQWDQSIDLDIGRLDTGRYESVLLVVEDPDK